MAEKKFFVDINLQGSALTNAKIGTNSGIGSTEGAFGYDSSAHRLQYFDGTATKEVANLSDIAAVTGGLIFQGGYDAEINTPFLFGEDGTVSKGFFWVVTTGSSFLGESVQVGDSIVAKVDNAGATLSDWLILQGNVVIATDSVDGISRLATQTEANNGTEGGAVVITPATLQGKIDAQITPLIESKVSKAGDTMSGNLNMGDNNINNVNIANITNVQAIDVNVGDKVISNIVQSSQVRTNILDDNGQDKVDVYTSLDFTNSQGTITNLPAPTNGGDATNKTYVDDNTSNKLPLAGGTMTGNINMGGTASIQGADFVSADRISTNNLDGFGSDITVDNGLDFGGNNLPKNLSAPTNGGDATNKDYVDDQDALKLSLTGGIMGGNIDMANNSISNAASVNTTILGAFLQSAISLNSNLDAQNSAKIINLPAPTDPLDATNKTYVDGAASTAQTNAEAYADSLAPNYDAAGSAATAESNANAYTDTTVSNLSGKITLLSADWIFEPIDGVYYQGIDISAFGYNPIVQILNEQLQVIEMATTLNGQGMIDVISNILPTSDFYLLVSKVF